MSEPIKIPSLSDLPQAEHTPTVKLLLTICHQQQKQIASQQEQIASQQEQIASQQKQITSQQEQIVLLKEKVHILKDEIARLKGHKPKPKIRPSKLNPKPKKNTRKGKRPGSSKSSKNAELKIHKTIVIRPKEKIPKGSRNKGYEDFTVVGLRFEPENIRYRVQVWKTPDGRTIKGEIPGHLHVMGNHFSVELVSYIQHQYHHCLVPQHLIHEQLKEAGVQISTGQINSILVDHKEQFHDEKEDLLKIGLEVSPYIHTDDTGARHNGRNGYCLHIGNAWFAYFMSTQSKSRINFLEILRAGHTDYVMDSYALEYMRSQKLPKKILAILEAEGDLLLEDKAGWDKALRRLGIRKKRHVKIVTEGALLASVVSHEIHPNLAIISDDAGQFNILIHALCWIHAERILAKLVGVNLDQKVALEKKRREVWDLYNCLKLYKEHPTADLKQELTQRFDLIFSDKTCFATLNNALTRLYRNKPELMLVLDRPEMPLQNNLSENDIREYVSRRKRNGSTRSDAGRKCRDTFVSLKKTCRKLGVSFWRYLIDRNAGLNKIPPLSELIRQRALGAESIE